MAKLLKWNNVQKTVRYIKKNGLFHAYYAAKERIQSDRAETYVYVPPTAEEWMKQREETKDYPYRFSIVVPTFETREVFLRELINSVVNQSYVKWELIIVDASQSAVVEDALARYQEAKEDMRIKYYRLAENKGISANTNVGIKLATGDYIAFLDHDDILTPDALYSMAVAVAGAPLERPVMLYSDEDKYENNTGFYINPHIKSEFNLDMLLSNNYICHFTAIENTIVKQLLLRTEYDGAQDFDLVLRVIDYLLKHNITTHDIKNGYVLHIPKVLYHWRCHPESTASNTASKMYAYEAGKRAVEDFGMRRGWKLEVSHALHLGFYDIHYQTDFFEIRKDVGVTGGSLLNGKNRICGGMYDDTGRCVFEGLHREFSGGSTHRAAVAQDCSAVDIRCMRVRKELQPLYEQITGIRYREKEIRVKGIGVETKTFQIADTVGLTCDEAGYRKLSMEFCRVVRSKGYLVLWNPDIKKKWKLTGVSR